MSVEFLIHYLDDFLLVGRPGTTECSACLQCLLQSFDRLGFPIALDKLEGPSTCLTFLVDPVAMTVRLPSPKLMELKQEVDRVITLLPNDRSCTKKDFESLVGRLAHASQVVQPGKTFMRNLSELLASRHHCKPWHLIRLNVEARADLFWWSSFIESWNGISIIPGDGEVFQIGSDASDSWGCGAVYRDTLEWIQLPWSEAATAIEGSLIPGESITFKELLPVVLACSIWGCKWRGNRVVCHCDNAGAVAAINSGYSRVAPIMHLLRCLFFIQALFEFEVKAVHVPGTSNGWADATSRNHAHLFLSQVQGAIGLQSLVPLRLVEIVLDLQPGWTSFIWTRRFRSCFQQE